VPIIHIDVELYGPHGAGYELDRLEAGPGLGGTLMAMEGALAIGYAVTEGRVHVITGALKASGHPESSYDGDTWTGVLSYARYPGIYELARGDTPSKHHPDGRHYFFDPGGHEFEHGVRQAVWDWVTDGEGGPAPDEGLPWASGEIGRAHV
jgi:hypothetical protein